jgi:hypothetical protein
MEFNIDPYYDDFEDNAKNNNYMRILFKPGKAVQARELTQIQSILQNQIKQFGDHVFQDGSPVIGGNLTLDNKVRHVKLLESYNNVDIEIDDFDRKVVRNTSGSVQAKVLATYFPTDGVPTLIVKYLTGLEFQDGDVIKIAGTTTQAQLIASNASGQATVVSINDGVFYVDGFFVQVSDQTVVAQAYGVNANVKVGLEITDTIVDSEIDTTLLDPAQGSFNYQAPGGDRYQFNLTLSTRPLDSVVDEAQFFELMRLENGIITKQVKYPVYAELEKTLARRTFDESGDYTVRPFRATVLDGTDANNYTLAIEPGKAYVKGFEFETLGTIKIDVEKPRSAADVKQLSDIDVDTSSGNYLYVTSVVSPGQGNAFINIASFEKLDIHCGLSSQINVGLGGSAANGFIYQNTKIGTARVRDFIRDDNSTESIVDGNGVYRIYLTDVNITPKVLKASGTHTSTTLNVASGQFMPRTNGLYTNVSITILPIRLDAVENVYATALGNTFTVNANNNGTFAGKVNVGDIVRVGDFAKEVTAVATGNLTVNSAFAYTMANSSSNPVVVYKQTEYSQNVSEQTRTIANSWWQANYATLEVDRAFDNDGVPDNNTVFQLNFGVDDAKCLVSGVAVANSLLANVNVAMNIALDSKLITGDTYLSDPQDKIFIYQLPGSFVRRTSINNADYEYDKMVMNKTVSGTPGVFVIGSGTLAAAESIPWSGTTSSIRDNLVVYVRDKGASSTPNGSLLNLTSANVTVTSSQITIDTGDAALQAIDAVVRVKLNDTEDLIRTKTYYADSSFSADPFTYPTSNATANVEVSLTNLGHVASLNLANGLIWLSNPSFNAVRPGDSISLFLPDVVKVNKVLMGNTTHYPDSNNVEDITERFVFDYGQRDDKYDHARIILKQGYGSPSGKLLVHVDFYHHIFSTVNKLSFFGPSSYSQEQYDDNLIPVYAAQINGGIYNLRDCLDFRPSRPIGDVSDSFNVPNIPNPDSTTELSFDYYMARIDKLVLSKDKEFRIIKGKSGVVPSVPRDDDDAMTLYTLRLPPYVNDVQAIRMEYNENRRFTMKDISSLDKRIEKLEFFVSLNNVEKLAMSDKTSYEDNTEKEKYGIVGENFQNFSIADFKDPAFSCGLDRGFLIPRTETKALSFANKFLSNAKLNKKTISLNFTETPAISQNLASDKAVSVQPFLFGQFNGIVEMYPETDFWVENKLKPEVITVPERIIVEHTTVYKETVIERQPQITIEQIFPTRNVETIIIREPAVVPIPSTPDVVIVDNPPPPIIVQPDVPVEPPPPPPPPEPPPLPWEPPPPPPEPPTPIDLGSPPDPIWIPYDPPPVPPDPEPVVVTQPIAAGGGGCVVLESFIPLVESTIVNKREVKQAFQLISGFKISLGSENESLEPVIGTVVNNFVDVQPCVRIETESGISLVCSTTAPIYTKELEFVNAPDLMGRSVACMKDGATFWDKVVSVESVGDKFVNVIDAGGTAFWAGEKEDSYILHHNVKAWNRTDQGLEYDKK